MTAKISAFPARGPSRGSSLVPAILAVLAAALVAPACAVGMNSRSATAPPPRRTPYTPPPPQTMNPDAALGLWHSSFGAVKIETDTTRGGSHLMGVWLYDRSGEDVIGFFTGALRGNVMEFAWHEPAQPTDLGGAGYLIFDPNGGRFAGKWWTRDQTRTGDWNGWRAANHSAPVPPPPSAPPPPLNPTYGSGDAPDYDAYRARDIQTPEVSSRASLPSRSDSIPPPRSQSE